MYQWFVNVKPFKLTTFYAAHLRTHWKWKMVFKINWQRDLQQYSFELPYFCICSFDDARFGWIIWSSIKYGIGRKMCRVNKIKTCFCMYKSLRKNKTFWCDPHLFTYTREVVHKSCINMLYIRDEHWDLTKIFFSFVW